jgi:hypothetical protein
VLVGYPTCSLATPRGAQSGSVKLSALAGGARWGAGCLVVDGESQTLLLTYVKHNTSGMNLDYRTALTGILKS